MTLDFSNTVVNGVWCDNNPEKEAIQKCDDILWSGQRTVVVLH